MSSPASAPSGDSHDLQAAQIAEQLTEAGLVHVSDEQPGFRRRRAGKGFSYIDTRGQPIRDDRILTRIRALAIPPAYTDVWICARPNGHLQATGRDARGRKQYRYHARWHEVREEDKYGRMIAFGEALPRLRRRLKRDLALPGLPRDKVLAVVVTLLGETLARIGNIEYARDNRSYGLTTLRDRHLQFVRAGRAWLRFRGKSGLEHEIAIDDTRLARIVQRCQQLPGQHLFQYLDEDGARQPVDSGMVNDYLRDAMGGDFSAKDFRTWGGTLRALAVLAQTPLPEAGGERAVTSTLAAAIKQVACELRNTPAVCRKSYIHPAVLDGWREAVIGDFPRGSRQQERFLLGYLRRRQRAQARRLRQRAR
ncbi:DNA topoisomerase IB [Coralloluteibacterium stylophorae]|uniref:DNA topoisomerase IB n=1 Tax=Coralloluteibacterium stylophorae TaxID=1776034 RepID=A0A8J8AWE0_9GAMM|nr:DNA topoisomerase IB [Coralloluteibacterium stylophorae]MBS7458147.1 DNA topoisomerase IB [Coralloluteibacterium stylophorae]